MQICRQRLGLALAGLMFCLALAACSRAPVVGGRATSAATAAAGAHATAGPLRVHPENPRYFADATGRAVYLTGAHTWNNVQDMLQTGDSPLFDFPAYLYHLGSHGHNFTRLWRWELVSWKVTTKAQKKARLLTVTPQPWARTGPRLALDGQPCFDLARFDEAYFERLRARAAAARDRGIYVSVMLFEGWGLRFAPGAWEAHPFHPDNNVNGINGDTDGDGSGVDVHTLADARVTELQEAYVRQVVTRLNGLDNLLYEISNEGHPGSTEWQHHFIRFIKNQEGQLRYQHPVGMVFQFKGGKNETLFASPADWVSPGPKATGRYDYRNNPPPADGRKVVLSDSDHLWGIGGSADWVWKTFTRGHQPLFMDPYHAGVLHQGADAEWDKVRRACGRTLWLARRLDLARTTPSTTLASTGYCLAAPGQDYVVFVPGGGEVELDLSGDSGTFAVEWVPPIEGEPTSGGTVEGAAVRAFAAPWAGDAVMHLTRQR